LVPASVLKTPATLQPIILAPAPKAAAQLGPAAISAWPVSAAQPQSARSASAQLEQVQAALAAPAAFDGSGFRTQPPPVSGQVDDYFGQKVRDPYRKLEDPNSQRTKSWVASQNRASAAFLRANPVRARVMAMFERMAQSGYQAAAQKHGDYFIVDRREEGREQPVTYKAKHISGPWQVLLDPNIRSPRGKVEVAVKSFSPDGKYLAYSQSSYGSDWKTWRIRDVATGQDLPDTIKWNKFFPISWSAQGDGFYYNRFARPPPGQEYTAVTGPSTIYYHKLGTPQSRDEKFYAAAGKPGWAMSNYLMSGNRFLVVEQRRLENDFKQVWVQDQSDQDAEFVKVFEGQGESFELDEYAGGRFYAHTDQGAPLGRYVAIDLKDPRNWKDIIPESKTGAVLVSVSHLDKGFAAVWRVDAHDEVWVHGPRGGFLRKLQLPGPGTVDTLYGLGHGKGRLTYSSYTHPRTDFAADLNTGKIRALKRSVPPDWLKHIETKQVLYPSADGTLIPMTLIYKKGLKLYGKNPTYLYGYGGFNNALTPEYSNTVITWAELGGIYAVANLRGGGEFGRPWHDAGRRENKQNVFDDFHAAAQWLIDQGYTNPQRLAAGGGSNGGLLVGAAIAQRPELFAAAVPEVGVMDMLRFHLFTVGAGGIYDYGSSAFKAGFKELIKYSPLHNLKPGSIYPATLVMTGDHDDRVVPAHSYKFTAALQAAQVGKAPVLLRVARGEGHGGNGSISAARMRVATIWAFLFKVFGLGAGD
jgi:prolyl oligopeptidase